jgi:hypothetical protein
MRAIVAAGRATMRSQRPCAPGLRPHDQTNYQTNYHAAFVIGPDGRDTDVVRHAPGS